MIDIDHQLLPDDITLPLLWLGLLFNLDGTYVSLTDALSAPWRATSSCGAFTGCSRLLTGKEGMGYGDFKLLAALGAWLGWQMLPLIILLSSLVGAICGIALMIVKRRGREIPIPFGPYLAIAGWIALLWGDGTYGLAVCEALGSHWYDTGRGHHRRHRQRQVCGHPALRATRHYRSGCGPGRQDHRRARHARPGRYRRALWRGYPAGGRLAGQGGPAQPGVL